MTFSSGSRRRCPQAESSRQRARSSAEARVDLLICSAFDCAGGEAADDVLDEAEVQDDDGYRDEHAARGEARELGVRHGVEADGDGPHLALLEQQLGQQAVAPGPGELRERGVDQHGLRQRQGYLGEDLQLVRAVDGRGLVDGVGYRVEVTLLHEVAQRCRAGVVEDERFQAVEQVQLAHDDVDRGHAHETREHAQEQRGLADCVASLEAEAAHDVARQDGEQGADDAGHGRNVESVEEPAPIGIEAVHVVGEQVHKSLGRELLREEAGKGMYVAALRERGRDEPDTGEKEYERDDDKDDVGDDVVGDPRRPDAAFFFHWNVSSLLYAAERT